MISSGWSSLRRLTLDRLVPGRRAWSGEELRATESEARPLPLQRRGRTHPFLPRYQSTGSCCLCPQSAELWKKGLFQSAPSVFSPAPFTGKRRINQCSHPPFFHPVILCPICHQDVHSMWWRNVTAHPTGGILCGCHVTLRQSCSVKSADVKPVVLASPTIFSSTKHKLYK